MDPKKIIISEIRLHYLENSDQRPKQVIKICSCRNVFSVLALKDVFASKQIHSQYTGRKNEEYQQSKECHDVIHCMDHYKQLTLQGWQKTDQLEYAQ